MTPEHPKVWVDSFASNVTSQHGEDGVLAELFKCIGAANKWCVEFGALNGTHHSNTWNLIMNEGWSAVLIEADPTYAEKLKEVYKDKPEAICINEFVEFEGEHSLDNIFARTKIPKDFDLVSIDIDGNDYHVWESLSAYKPRVVVIEFNPTIPNDISFVQPRDMSVQQGSSLLALKELGTKKGYTLTCVVGLNAVFVLNELVAKLGLAPASLDEMYDGKQYFTRLFQLYDGTLVLDGYKELFWHHMPITDEAIQVLPANKRTYQSGVSSSGAMRTFKFYIRKSPMYPLLMRLKKLIK